MKQINPRQLKLARRVRNMTQGQLSELIPSLNQGNLSKVEQSLLNVSETTVAQIAKALDFPPSFFYQQVTSEPLSTLHYRKQAAVAGKALSNINAEIEVIANAIDILLEDVAMDRPFERLHFDIKDSWTPEKAALVTRELLGIPSGPIHNLITHIERSGIIVYLFDTPVEGFDGAALLTLEKRWPILFVNGAKSNDRIRMSIAHELAHMVMHLPFIVEPFREKEKEAKDFASEFLMPSSQVKPDLIGLTYNALTDLKEYWKVSKAALIYKAHTLKLITDKKYTYLYTELARRKERKVENGYVDIDKPSFLKEIISLYRSQRNYSVRDLAEITGLTERDFEKYFCKSDDKIGLRLIPSV